MKRLIQVVLILFVAALPLAGCGGGGSDPVTTGSLVSGSTPSDSGTITSDPSDPTPSPAPAPDDDPLAGVPDTIVLQDSVQDGTKLSQGGSAVVTATVRDQSGVLVPDGITVNFSADKGTIPVEGTTVDGIVSVTYQAGTSAGIATITASAAGNSGIVQDTTTIEIANGEATSIVTKSVQPQTIGIRGSGIEDTSLLTFEVRDSGGNPAADGTLVTFTLGTSINGGEQLSASSAETADGIVTVAFQAGNVPGTVAVRANVDAGDSTLTTEARITIASNRPDAGRITMGAEILNLAGGVTLGLQSTVSAYIGDRAGNVVPDGTPVSFISECGTIGESGGFETSTNFGVASAVFQTSAPTVPDLGGVAPQGNPGLCRLVSYTPGKGTYIDQNGNGIFDSSVDSCTTDMDEPYIDANDSGSWEAGEYFVDVNQDGQFNTDVVNCQDDTMIWTSMNLLISDYVAPLNLTPTSFNLAIGEAKSFTLNFSDLWGNALVSGTTLSVTSDGGTLVGITDFTQADTTGSGGTLSFALFSDTASDAEAKPVTVTATISPASGPQGNNGAETFEIASGMINLPESAEASIFLSDSLPMGSSLAQGETTTITAVARDSDGNLLSDGSAIDFYASDGTITASALTVDGTATATFTAPFTGGPVTITAVSPLASNTHTVNIANGDASSIILESVSPDQIGVKGSGLGDTSTITFSVVDEKGLPVSDGTAVSFAIDTPLGGGESLSTNSADTSSGKVSVILQSGVRAGTAAITASITAADGSIISTVARVIIAAGLPDEKHFSLSATTLNVPGYTYFGETSELRAYVADRYSNPVPQDTPIFFESEAGAMALTEVRTTELGQAVATHITQAPYPDTVSNVTGLPGATKILAWTAGQESFVDYNGNGQYDSGEPFGDIGEPFIDANDDNDYDAAATIADEERYVDLNGNGAYDGPNGAWDGDTFIWTTHNILWSFAAPSDISLNVTPSANCPDFVIPNGEGCECTISVTDSNGSPIFGGSELSVGTSISSGSFTLSPSSFTIPDATRPGTDTTEFTFNVTNSSIDTSDFAFPVTVTLDVPEIAGSSAFSKTKTITVTLSPP